MVFDFILFLAIMMFLVVIKSGIERKFYDLNDEIQSLRRLVESLKIKDEFKDIKEKVVEKEIIKEVEFGIPILDLHEFVPVDDKNVNVTKVVFEAPIPMAVKLEAVYQEQKKSFYKNFKEKNPDLEKFIGENLISKIGIFILVLGVSYFVKYSIDKGWISEPLRVALGILTGTAVLGIAHKLRQEFAAFSSVFVAGAISIFYFTIAVAFHDYKLFGQEVAFSIMVLITGFAAAITVFYNRLELGIMTLIAGFAVPFMVSTGADNYAVLFTYMLILDIGILAVAYFKQWNVLNLLAFVFTNLLFASWLLTELNLPKPHYVGGLVFAFLFYVLFCIITIINTLKVRGEFSKLQMGVIAANTFLFYSFGIAILNKFHPEFRGIFTAAVGIFNLGYAYFIFKKFGADKKVLYLLIGLTLTFITLTVPVQFNGHYITMFWAIEAVMLLWLSQKSKIDSYKFCAVVVHLLMVCSLVLDWYQVYNGSKTLSIVFSPIFTTGLISIVSCFMLIFLLKKETETTSFFGINFNPIDYSKFQLILGISIAYFVGLLETDYQSNKFCVTNAGANAITWFYHLLFTAILCFVLIRYQFQKINLIIGLAVFNIFAFTFYISGFAFTEHHKFIETAIFSRTAFWVHYLSLAVTIYFAYLTFRFYKNQQLPKILYHAIIPWVAMFFIVYATSTELLIHGLIFSNDPINIVDVQKQFPNSYAKTEESWMKEFVSDNRIAATRTILFKSGMPVLWGSLAFLFLILGIKKQSRILRIMALSLLGITILKLFLYDIRNASETGRIIAFILLGVLILIISFVYQKLKVLVIDDKKTSENHE
ncbi:MAG: hypothetical protein RLZZ312_440 [Bacteroidota bacterium]